MTIAQIGVGKLFANLFGDTSTHDTMAIDLMDDDIDIGFKKISLYDLDHVISPSSRSFE